MIKYPVICDSMHALAGKKVHYVVAGATVVVSSVTYVTYLYPVQLMMLHESGIGKGIHSPEQVDRKDPDMVLKMMSENQAKYNGVVAFKFHDKDQIQVGNRTFVDEERRNASGWYYLVDGVGVQVLTAKQAMQSPASGRLNISAVVVDEGVSKVVLILDHMYRFRSSGEDTVEDHILESPFARAA